MKFIKKHISIIIAIIVIILIIAGAFLVKEVFFPNESKAIYGSRLEGRDSVKISNKTKNKIKEDLSEGTSKVDVRIAGRIIYIDVTGNADLTLDSAKGLGQKALESFKEEELAYYDIQIIIDKEESTQFPIIGYKHHTKTAISWTRDRAES